MCTALAIVFCAMTAYLPLSVMPLYLAAFCIFLACKRGNLVYGILCALATVGVMFAFVGLTVKWFFLLFMFAPYGKLAYFIHRFNYFKLKGGLIRGGISILFFNLTLGFIYLVATRVLAVGLDIPVTDWVNRLGGYIVLAAIATIILVPLDFIFSTLSLVVLKRIPPFTDGKRKRTYDETPNENRGDDIFGYDEPRNDNDDEDKPTRQ